MEKVCIGKVVKLHGYLGMMKVNAKYDKDFNLKQIKIIYDKDEKEYQVTRLSQTKDGILVMLDGVGLEVARGFIGQELFVDRTLVADKMLIEDLKGSSVYFENETLIGTVSDIQDYGSAEVFEIKRNGKKSVLFPNVKGLITSFDYKEKKLVLNEQRYREVADED